MLTSNQLTCFIINIPFIALYLSNRESKRSEKKNWTKKLLILKCKVIVHSTCPPPPTPPHPTPLKLFFPLPSLFHLLLRYFRQLPHPHGTPSCLNPTNQLSLVQTNIKRVILPVQMSLSIKKQFIIFEIPVQIGFLNLWDIFRFIFR